MDNKEKKLTLNEIGLNYNSDKSSSYHNYLNLYDKFFNSYRDKNINILEIGILNGESLKIFQEYFNFANIIGIDINDKSHIKYDRVTTIKGDQSDKNLLNNFKDDFFDIILDDGSHKMSHQQISFGLLFKKLKSNGIYVIEDLHTSYNEYRENIIYGDSLFGLETDNRTIDFLNGLASNNEINKFLTSDEYKYLKENIKSIEISETHRKNSNEFSITSIIIKK
jgi:hypothetical protein